MLDIIRLGVGANIGKDLADNSECTIVDSVKIIIGQVPLGLVSVELLRNATSFRLVTEALFAKGSLGYTLYKRYRK
jgi:hypothetical protein